MSEKVRELHAWLIKSSGQVEYGKDDIIDRSRTPTDVYNESRFKINRRVEGC